MIKTTTQFAGYECIQIGNDTVSLWIAKSFGPRVIAFTLDGGRNLFAELPDARLECPGAGYYSLRGGHRLWSAPENPPRTLKIGFPNPAGWLGYFLNGTLFVKYARYDQKELYYDHQSSSECYCDAGALELETLGPCTTLGPGESVTHRELWKVFPCVSFEASEDSVKQLVEEWGI